MHAEVAKVCRIVGIESDMSDPSNTSETKEPAKKRGDARKRQARAMTRAIDRVSDEFIEAFSQTGLDDGPEKPKKAKPVQQALLDREDREKREKIESQNAAQPTFKGLGALLASSAKKPTGSFARLLESDQDAQPEGKTADTNISPAAPGTNADGSVIRVRDTVGKKRGLYTSCMQRPDEAQLKAWAKMAEIEKAEAEKVKEEKARAEVVKTREPEVKTEATNTRSVLHKLASTSHVPPRQPIVTPPAAAPTNMPFSSQPQKSQKNCAIRGGCAKLGTMWQRFTGWLKTRF